MVESQQPWIFLCTAGPEEIFRVEFTNGEVILVRQCAEVDSWPDGRSDGLCGTVVDIPTADAARRRQLPIGSGVDFHATDIARVYRVSTNELLFPNPDLRAKFVTDA